MPETTRIDHAYNGLEIAVIGMSGRFPGAEDIGEFWANLVDGVDAISRFSDEELIGMGVSAEALDNDSYVRAKGVFPNIEFFDSAFFNYTPADATVLDPQVRALHEEVYRALEDAGYSAERRKEAVGLFLGATNNLAWETHTLRRYIQQSGSTFTGVQLNDKDFAATRIAYALNLNGPAFTLHTACSTSLVAIDMACRNIWTGACQIALAGGSGLTLPHKNGYAYQENMIHSPDGVCRAFDADAGGTIEGNGVGVVALKRLETALRDGDHVYAVIKGSAVNNDGNRKVGYTAPSIEGQAEVIRKAHKVARVSPSEVSYVETHGTGTALGDPVEVEALRKAFGAGEPRSTGIGSVKPSIGHLDTGAGVASFIKACQILQHRAVPQSLHFTEPNPNIRLDDGPFYVVAEHEELDRKVSADGSVLPLRVGVSAFGIGGTNAHLVLEEAPAAASSAATGGRSHNTFVIAAASADAIGRIKQQFVDHLARHPDVDPSDLAWTLQNRQRNLTHRYAVGFQDAQQLRERLQESLSAGDEPAQVPKNARREVCFVFSGLGAQHLGMARGLYDTEEAFRTHIDACLAISDAMGNTVPREVFFGDTVAAAKQLDSIETTQILLFMVEYSMAKTLIEWGLTPTGMVGHSTGELAAACISGAFSLEDGIHLVQARGTLMDQTPEGSLTSVKASEEIVRPMLDGGLAIAAVNSPTDCSVSGPTAALEAFERRCTEQGIGFTHVDADHAYHSSAMEVVLDRFRKEAAKVTFQPPTIPYVSNVTGTWITPEQATDPDYYCAHIRETVQFKAGVEAILERGDVLFVEVGPGKALSSFARSIGRGTGAVAVNMLRHRLEEVSDGEHLATAIKKLWEAGTVLDWNAYHRGRGPRKVSLPLYPFDKVAYPVDVGEFQRFVSDGDADGGGPTPLIAASAWGATAGSAEPGRPLPAMRLDWGPALIPGRQSKERSRVLMVFADDVTRVRRMLDGVPHWRTFYVRFGTEYQFQGPTGAVVRPNHDGDLKRLIDDVEAHALVGDAYVVQRKDHVSLIPLVRGLCTVTAARTASVRDLVVLDTGDALTRRPEFLPELLGLNLEYPGLRITALGAETSLADRRGPQRWRTCLQKELDADRADEIAVRYDGGSRSVPMMVPLHGRRTPAATRGGRTAIVCSAGVVEDVLDAVRATARAGSVDIVPFERGPAAAPADETGRDHGGATVLGAVTSTTWASVATRVAGRLRELSHVDDVIVWDALGPDDDPERFGAPARRLLLRRLHELSLERGFDLRVVARPWHDRHRWDSSATTWFAENAVIDAEVGVTRLYSHGRSGDDSSALDLVRAMADAGIRTAHHGMDLLAVQAAAKSQPDVADAGDSDQRDTVAGVIHGALVALLGYDEIDRRADIFDLGLDSVKLVQFTSSLEKSGYKVLASDVYNHPTIDGLAGFIGRAAKEINAEGRSFDSAAALLGARLDTRCGFHRVVVGDDSDSAVVLFVDGLDDDLRKQALAAINDLRLPDEVVPHFVLPGSAEDAFLADGTFAGLDLGPDLTGTGGIPALFDEIDRSQEDLRKSIAAQPVRWTYPISGTQKHYFARGAKPQLYLIQFRELVDVDILQRALRDVVGRHGLLRSFLVKSFGRLRWKEYEPPTDFALPQFDLSALPRPRQEEVRAELIKREWTFDLKVDQPMYQAMLLKYNERSYDLLFQIDHSIFDATSGQVLRGDLLRRYEELSNGSAQAMPGALSYRHLRAQAAKGPVGITADEIIQKFDLEAWAHYGTQVKAKGARYDGNRIRTVRYSVDLRRFEDGGAEVEPFSLVVHLYARLVARLLDVDKVPFDLVFQSREYEGVDYSEVMGMVVDVLPVVVSGRRGARDNLQELISDKLRLMNEHNVNFASMISGLRSMLAFGKVYSETKSARGRGNRPSCMVNYAGNVEDEYDAIWDMTLEQFEDNQETLDYADCYCVSKVSKGTLDIVVVSKWFGDDDAVVAILDDEVEHLVHDAPTGGVPEEIGL